MLQPRSVLLIVPDQHEGNALRAFLTGITERIGLAWDITVQWHRPTATDVARWSAQSFSGIIAAPYPEVLQIFARHPALVLASFMVEHQHPTVLGIDDTAVGALAAAHLQQQGATQVVVYGGAMHARMSACIAQAKGGAPLLGHVSDAVLTAWLRSLPRGSGVFAFNDQFAMRVVRLAISAGISVPEQLLVLGADDDPCSCLLAPVPLSSVRVPHRQLGLVAAQRLEALMAGQRLAQPKLLVPSGVTVRQSTDHLMGVDPELVAALRFIRANAHQPLALNDVVRATSLCRAALTRRFRQHLQRSIHDEISAARVRLAQQTLGEQVTWSLLKVAVASGFNDTAALTRAFRRVLGCSPQEWRNAHCQR
jgi:DNA-binding LacI/PurR family transcriptional regulator